MFYSTQILGRKGPLGIVWMAAHHERIHKQLVDSTSIPSTVDTLLDGDSAPLALRLSGQLLLGIVRIYARKVNYVHTDCNEAMLQIRLAFRRGATELAPGKAVASVADITLPTDLDEAALLGGTMPALSLTISELRPLPLDTSLSVRQQDLSGLFGSNQALYSGLDDEQFAEEEAALRYDLDAATVERLRAASRSASRSISVGGALRRMITPGSTGTPQAARRQSMAITDDFGAVPFNDSGDTPGTGRASRRDSTVLDSAAAMRTAAKRNALAAVLDGDLGWSPAGAAGDNAGTLEDLLPAGDEYLFGNATAVNANGTAGAFGGAHSNAGLTPPAEAGQKYDQPYDQYDQPYDPQDDMQYEQADGHVAGPDAETPSAGAAAAADGPDALADAGGSQRPQRTRKQPVLLSQEQAAQAAQRSAAAAARRKSQQQAQPQGTDASDREADDPTALPPAKKAARSGKQPSRRRPLAMDGEADQPATELNPVEVRALLADRTALLRQRGPRLGPQREAAALGPQHADLPLMVTAGMPQLPPALQRMFISFAMGSTAGSETAASLAAASARGTPGKAAANGAGPSTSKRGSLGRKTQSPGGASDGGDDAGWTQPSGTASPSPKAAAPAGGPQQSPQQVASQGVQQQQAEQPPYDDGPQYEPLEPYDDQQQQYDEPYDHEQDMDVDRQGEPPAGAAPSSVAEATTPVARGRATAAVAAAAAAGRLPVTPGSASHKRSFWEADGERLLEGNEREAREGDETGVLSTRTRAVVAAIQEQLQPTPRTKRSRGSDGAEGPAATTLPLSRLTAGKSRHGAATTFYEMLVLHNRGLARLRQDSPYGDIVVAPRLEEMAAAAAAV